MNPIISALIANPKVVDASRRAFNEFLPVVERSLKGTRAGKLVATSPAILTSCFAAGVVAGWMTAPAKGSETRAQIKGQVKAWAKSAGEQVQMGKKFVSEQLARRGIGSVTDTDEPSEAPSETELSTANGGGKTHPESAAHH